MRISIALENKGTKPIKGVKGEVKFLDMFGDEIRSIRLGMDDGIAPGKTLVWDGSIDYNQFIAAHQKLKDTPLDKMKVMWTPEVILFEDGSSLRMPNGKTE